MNEVIYPEMRSELIEYLAHLADRNYQMRVWVNKEYPAPNFYDDLSETCEVLEDLGVLHNPETRLGWILKSRDEVVALEALGEALDGIFSQYGTSLPDSMYLERPEWNTVIDAARAAREVLLKEESQG